MNLAGIVEQLTRERHRAQSELERLEAAITALGARVWLWIQKRTTQRTAFCFFHFAQRALCAARMLASPAAEIVRLRIGIGFERVLLALSLALLAR
jgi:hypothetical protein